MCFFFFAGAEVANSCKHACLDEMEELKGRDVEISEVNFFLFW